MKKLRLAFQFLGLATLATGTSWALYAYGATETRELFRFLLASLAGLLLLAVGSWKGTRSLNPALLAWGAYLLFQVSFSNTLEARGYGLFAIGWIALFLARFWVDNDTARRWLMLGLLAIGVVEGLVGIAQVLAPALPASRIATGTLYNQNHFAGLENMLFGMGLGALFAAYSQPGSRRSERIGQVWILMMACSLVGVAVFLSRSRAGATILVMSLLFAYVLQRLAQQQQDSKRPAAVPIVLVLVVALGVGSVVGLDALARRFETSPAGLQSRLEVYRDTLSLIADHPLGIGPMNYEWRFRPYQSAPGRVWYDYAHNDYLQIVAEWGIPLGLGLWIFVFWRLSSSVRQFLYGHDPWRRGVALGCSLAVFSIVLHSLVDFNLYIPVNQAIFCAILGLSWGLESRPASALAAPRAQ